MQKFIVLALFFSSIDVLADGYLGKEEPMPPIWIKGQSGTSVVQTRKTMKSSEPVNLTKALDPHYQESVHENKTFVQYEQENVFSPYISAKLGYGHYAGNVHVGFDTTPYDNPKSHYNAETMVMSLAFGVRLSDFRAELEAKTDIGSKDKGLFDHDRLNGKLTTVAMMANAYYDIPLKSKFRPYVGAGLGIGRVQGDIYGISQSTNNFAWQLMAGIGYDLTEHWKLDLGYNYISYGDLTIGKESGTKIQLNDITGHNIVLGTRYEF